MNLKTLDYTPTPEHRRLVESTSGVGLPYNEIASLIGIDEETLFQHYSHEIEVGQAKANAQIAKTIYNKAQEGDATSLKIWSDNQEKMKRGRGRPKGSFKTPMHHLAENITPGSIQKSDNQKLKELKKILLDNAGTNVVTKAIEIALNDNHPSQAAMIKLCMDRMLPVSMFEKERNVRSAVSITITGIGEVKHNEETIIDADMDMINERP
jgi:predicted transcriptional regulator